MTLSSSVFWSHLNNVRFDYWFIFEVRDSDIHWLIYFMAAEGRSSTVALTKLLQWPLWHLLDSFYNLSPCSAQWLNTNDKDLW